MKKYFILLLILISYGKISAQWDLNLSMGLDFKSSPSFRDYINSSFSTPGNQVASFKSSIGFAFESDYQIKNNLALGVEYNLQIDSYNTSIGNGGIYEISYYQHRPSLLAYYVVLGEGFRFKFGGGIGLRYVSLTERVIVSTDYKASGVGFLLRAMGNTIMSKDFYALVGVDLRYDLAGDVSNENSTLTNNATGEKLNMKSISIGIYLGITFTL